MMKSIIIHASGAKEAVSEAASELATAQAVEDAVDDFKSVLSKLFNLDREHMINTMINLGIKIIVILLIWFIGRKIIDLIILMYDKAAKRHKTDVSVHMFLRMIIKYALLLLLIVIILNYLDIGTASLTALIASCGVAVGLALQGSLSNFAGSIVLLAMKPFSIGDYIITSEGEGTVKIIGLIYTTLTTFENQEIHIPNGKLADSVINNRTVNEELVLRIRCSAAYGSDADQAIKVLTDLLKEGPYTVAGRPIDVFVDSLDADGMMIEGRCNVKTNDYWPARRYYTKEIKRLYQENGIEIPFPQVDVHMKD